MNSKSHAGQPDSRASKGGHDDGIGGNIRVIKFRDDASAIRDEIEGAGLSRLIETAILLRRLCSWTCSQVYHRNATLISYEGSPAGLLRRSVMNWSNSA